MDFAVFAHSSISYLRGSIPLAGENNPCGQKYQTENEGEEKRLDQLCLVKRCKAVFHKNVPKNKNQTLAMQ